MRRLSLLLPLLPLLLLTGCTPVDLTAAQVADKLQEQINELLEEVDKNLEEVADLDLDGLCANSGKITAGMDLLVPRYRAFAVLMEELGDIQQALQAGGAANQFALDVQKIRRDCANRAAAVPARTPFEAYQSPDVTAPDDEGLAPITTKEENPSGLSPAFGSILSSTPSQSEQLIESSE